MHRWVTAVAVAVAASGAFAGPAAAEPGPLFDPGTDVDYQLGGVWDERARSRRHRRSRPKGGAARPAATTSVTSTASRPSRTRRGSGAITGGWCSRTTAGRWSTRLGASGCSTSAPPRSARRCGRIVGRWTERCAEDGFDAVEYDNLDTFSRSHRLITRRRREGVRPAARRPCAQRGAAGRAEELGRVGRLRRLRLRGRRGVRPVARVRQLRGVVRRPRARDRVPEPRLHPHLPRVRRIAGRSCAATWRSRRAACTASAEGRRQSAQMPNSSRLWLTSAKSCSRQPRRPRSPPRDR